MQEFLLATLGLLILIFSGDMLVRGAVNASLRLGVPALIVSLTIVALGTSAPELLVSVSAVLSDAPGIAIGNVVGSNTANIMLVLGLPALLAGLNTGKCDTRASYFQMMLGTLAFMLVAWLSPITWLGGGALLALYALFMLIALNAAKRHRRDTAARETDIEGVDPGARWWRIALYLVLGVVGLPLGADILVSNATAIARAHDVSETVIGLTLIALGTSLPELATTVSAAFRNQAEVALGNVLGSNMANLLAIIGVSSFFGDIPVSSDMLDFDIWVMLAASLLLAPFALGRRNMSRGWGLVFTAAYVAYVALVLV